MSEETVKTSIFSGMKIDTPAKEEKTSIFDSIPENPKEATKKSLFENIVIDSQTKESQGKSLFENIVVDSPKKDKLSNISLIKTSIFPEKIDKAKVVAKKIFQKESFIPDNLDAGDFDEKEKTIIDDLRFGNDSVEKFISFAREVFDKYQEQNSLLVTILYRDEFAKSRSLLTRLLSIIEESDEVESFFSFGKAKKNPEKIKNEVNDIISSLRKYEKSISDSRTELNNSLSTFEYIGKILNRHKKVALYLLDNANYNVFDNPSQIKSVILAKISCIEEMLMQITTGGEVHTLRTFLVNFSLLIEEVIIQNNSFLLSLASKNIEPNVAEKKNTIKQKLKEFLQ